MDQLDIFETQDPNWTTQACPICKSRPATAHAQLFRDPPPGDGSIDDRKPIDEMYLHEDGTECRLVSTQ